jgi:hypothetical protein
MMIMEMPRRVREAARSSGGGLVARLLEPLFFRQRKFSGRVQLSSRLPEKRPESRAVPISAIERAGESNAPLDSLAGGTLAARFHAWRGASGRRYICSVFVAEAAEFEAGLPDFADAIALAVACESDGRRRCLSVFVSEAGNGGASRQAFVTAALAAGAVEWHIHLLAVDAQQRRLVAKDIEIGCFAETSIR